MGGTAQLLLSKTLSLLDGIQQLLFQLFIALVGWQIQTVEAAKTQEKWHGESRAPGILPQQSGSWLPTNSPCMAPGQPGFLANSVNAELLGSIAPCHPRQGIFCVNTDGFSQSKTLSLPSFQDGVHAGSRLFSPPAKVPRGQWKKNAPMSSANPPTGRRQVPVTNCSSRILFSLSISFTTYNFTRNQGCP